MSSSKRILVLDDDWRRLDKFGRHFIGHEYFKAQDVYEAITRLELSDEAFDAVFLDHDLTTEHYLAEDRPNYEQVYQTLKGTGREVAEFIADPEKCPNPPKLVFVHTLNKYGAFKIGEALRKREGIKVVRWPFSEKEAPPLEHFLE